MKRLIEGDEPGASLVAAAAAGVGEPDRGAKARVQAQLDAHEVKRLVSPRWIAVVGLVAGTAAAASLLVRAPASRPKPVLEPHPTPTVVATPKPIAPQSLVSIAPAPLAPPTPTVEVAAPPAIPRNVAAPPHRIAAPAPAAIAPTPQPEVEAPPTPTPTPSETPTPTPESPTPTPEAPAISSSPAYSPRLAFNAADSTLVVSATRAIAAHDDRGAIELLDAYLARSPDGDLIEESLALEIEARSHLGDASAASFAERYLARFPTGRFRTTALRANARFVKHPTPAAH
ncbi:MAG TPA: hypothetical protein VGG74_26790 [Kofleriaceae bacterium]|jgi:hypothetical protein